MKTLHVINSIDKTLGGQVYAALNIIRMENLLGIKPTVLTSNSKNIDPLFTEYSTIEQFSYSFPNRLYNTKGAVAFYKKHFKQFDLIVLHGVWSMLLYKITQIGYKNNIPMIMWPHGSIDPFDLQKKKYLKRIIGPIFIKKLLNKLDALICTSKLEEKIIIKYGATVNTLSVPLPVFLDKQLGTKERFRKKYNLSKKDFVILFLSRIDYKKGLNLLLPAIKKIIKTQDKIKLIIAGTGSEYYEKIFSRWINENKIMDYIKCIGFISDQEKADAFAGSDCFALPSLNENFGIAVVEALNAGIPVMISKNVYIWEEIINYNGGWVCEYSTKSVSDTIEEIYKNKNEYNKKKNSAKNAGAQFLPNNLKENYKMLYQKIITEEG